MGRCRSMLVLVLVFAWTVNPALACLPTATMTRAEMACCKKMAGDCQMGSGRHSCCKTKAEQATPVALLTSTSTQVRPQVIATLLNVALLPQPTTYSADIAEVRGLSPPAPPGLNPVLRI
jgi:hypothetical protein